MQQKWYRVLIGWHFSYWWCVNTNTMEDECEKLFHKLYNFPSCTEPCVHIKPECIFQGHHWEIPKLVKLRDKLNETKCLLSDMDIKLWRQHTQFTNKAGAVQNLVKRTIHPELCTQAWCKFCEILVTFNLVETIAKRKSSGEEATLFSVHLCEAPGAFVTSLNHRLRSTGGLTVSAFLTSVHVRIWHLNLL